MKLDEMVRNTDLEDVKIFADFCQCINFYVSRFPSLVGNSVWGLALEKNPLELCTLKHRKMTLCKIYVSKSY